MVDKVWKMIFAAGLIVGVMCVGYAFASMFIWRFEIWPFRPKASMHTFGHQENALAIPKGISVHLLDGTHYYPSMATIPRESFNEFWRLLRVDAEDWNKFTLDRQMGKLSPVAPKFPLLSELADIEIENIDFSADQIDELRIELDAARTLQGDRFQNIVLHALSEAVIVASAEKKGLILSPFS